MCIFFCIFTLLAISSTITLFFLYPRDISIQKHHFEVNSFTINIFPIPTIEYNFKLFFKSKSYNFFESSLKEMYVNVTYKGEPIGYTEKLFQTPLKSRDRTIFQTEIIINHSGSTYSKIISKMIRELVGSNHLNLDFSFVFKYKYLNQVYFQYTNFNETLTRD